MVGYIKRIIKDKDGLPVLFLFLIGMLAFTWFRPGFFVWGDDTQIPLNLHAYVKEYYYLWTWKIPFSLPDASKFALLSPLGFILSFFSFFHLPFSPYVFQILIVYLLFSFSGFSAYYLFRILFPNSSSWGRLFAGLFYMFNLYSFIQWHSFSWIIFFYVFFPLIFALYIKGISEKKKLSFFLFLSILWTLSITPAYATAPFVIISWFILLLYLTYYIFINEGERKKAVLSTLYLMISWIFLNVFWILPLVIFSQSEFVRRAVGVDPYPLLLYNSTTFADIFRFLAGPGATENYKDVPYYPWFVVYKSAPFIILGFFISFFAFLPFLFHSKNKNLIFVGLLTIIFIFLVSGLYSPFPEGSAFLFSQFKFELIFRSVWQRFMGIVILGIALLFAYSIDKIINLITKSANFKSFKYPFIVLTFVTYIIVYAFPFWNDQVFPQRQGLLISHKVKIPHSYYELATWLDKQPNNFNVLPLPFPRMAAMVFSWENGSEGFAGTYPLYFLSNHRFLITDFNNQISSELIHNLMNKKKGDSAIILKDYNIKYIIFHKDAHWEYINKYANIIPNDQASIKKVLLHSNILKKEREFGDMEVYYNTAWTPNHLHWLSSSKDSNEFALRKTREELNEPLVEFQRINPTKYKIYVKGLDSVKSLAFLEIYNKDWNLYIKKKPSHDWCKYEHADKASSLVECEPNERLFETNDLQYLWQKSMFDGAHRSVNNYTNVWELDPNYIKSNYDKSYYKENSDGSIDIEMTLYFKPQSYIYIGFILSGIALFSIISFLTLQISIRRSVTK